MSGGSYNYLCHKESSDLMNATGDIQAMADRLDELGWANDAALETKELLSIIYQSLNKIDIISNRLSLVWRAVEWRDSGDLTDAAIQEALKKYRGE